MTIRLDTVVFDDRTLPVYSQPLLAITPEQKAHLHSLSRGLGLRNVAVVGFDAVRQPVVRRRDANGIATYTILRTGHGRPTVGPVTPLDDDEVIDFNPADLRFLAAYPTTLKEATP